MPYVKSVPSTKVPLTSDPSYWVLWRPVLRYGQVKDITLAATTVDARGERQMDSGIMTDGILLAHIEDWNLDGEDGVKLPISTESLALLADVDANQLAELLQTQTAVEDATRKN